MTELNVEKQNFEKIIDEYNEAISDTKLKISNLPRLCPDLDLRIAEKKRLERKVNQLIKNKKKPYFARIDFQNSNNAIKDICYIGKVGLTNYDHKIITVDWRAPISNLYYDSNVGPASYLAPEGKITGELLLKRQYNIEDGKFIDYNDVDTVSNDEILKPYLSVNADKRLKNMVFIQCTNPLVTTYDIDECIKKHPYFDSIVSTVVQKRFYWKLNSDNSISEIEHDIRKRPRRQDWNGVLCENGSIYVISKENLYKGRCRAYGKKGTHIMSDDSYYEIDEPVDWYIIEMLLKRRYDLK